MIKTYKSINSVNLFTSVEVNGKIVSVSFDGGSVDASGKVTNGTLTTEDEKLQKAIEADSSYNKSFVVVGDVAKPGTMDDGNDDFEQVPGITNAQAAAEWLTTNKQVIFDATRKAGDVKAKALELKVDFVEWK